MTTPTDIAQTFFLTLCHFIFIMDGAPNISPAMMNTLTNLRDALYAHDTALKELSPYESRETDFTQRLLLSQSLYRGVQTNRMIGKFFTDCCGTNGQTAGILKKRMRAVFLTAQLDIATAEQYAVIDEYKLATGKPWGCNKLLITGVGKDWLIEWLE